MRTPLTSASLANGADVALHGITRLSSNEARTAKRTMASSRFCWLLSPAVRLDSSLSRVRNCQPESRLYYGAIASNRADRPLLALLRHADCTRHCPFSGAKRKTYARVEVFSF